MHASLASGMFLHENTKVKVTTIYNANTDEKLPWYFAAVLSHGAIYTLTMLENYPQNTITVIFF